MAINRRIFRRNKPKNIKKIKEDNNNKMGVFSMPFMKNVKKAQIFKIKLKN